VWIAADAGTAPAPRGKIKVTRLETTEQGCGKTRIRFDIRHGGIEIKSLDAPYIACNADFNIQPNFRQELEQKLMAPRRRLITA
jgi:hypothetical protein